MPDMPGQPAQPEPVPQDPDEGGGRCASCAKCINRHCTDPRAAFGYVPRGGRVELGRDLAHTWQRCPGFKRRS